MTAVITRDGYKMRWAHIQHTRADLVGKAWCGEAIRMEWCFQDICHAAYECARPTLAEVVPCQDCIDNVVRVLRVGGEP